MRSWSDIARRNFRRTAVAHRRWRYMYIQVYTSCTHIYIYILAGPTLAGHGDLLPAGFTAFMLQPVCAVLARSCEVVDQ